MRCVMSRGLGGWALYSTLLGTIEHYSFLFNSAVFLAETRILTMSVRCDAAMCADNLQVSCSNHLCPLTCVSHMCLSHVAVEGRGLLSVWVC